MVTFTRAETVSRGTAITSRQLVSLARAANDRILSGCGDVALRISYADFNLWRQVRNPDASGFKFPPQAEAYEIYHHVTPAMDRQWPITGPGMPEGANLGNPIMQYVFGTDATPSEPDRVGVVPLRLPNGGIPQTASERWYLGALQRGVIDPENGQQNVPALQAAQHVFEHAFFTLSPMHKTWGGRFPQPAVLLDHCDDLSGEPYYWVPSLEFRFTGLAENVSTSGLHGSITTNADGNPVVTYAGSCPCESTHYASGHVQAIVAGAFAYYVVVGDGGAECGYNVDRLPYSDWIAGPYTDTPTLSHVDGQQLQRALHAFASDFRGSVAQRTGQIDIERVGWRIDQVGQRQWPLAPAYGRTRGNSIVPEYPTARFHGAALIASGTVPRWDGGATAFRGHEGFVVAGFHAEAIHLHAPLAVEFIDGDAIVAVVQLDPDDAGNASASAWPKTARRPGALQVRLSGDARFTHEAGAIVCQAAELIEYKPEWWDIALAERLLATDGGMWADAGADGVGQDQEDATAQSNSLMRHGMLLNLSASAPRSLGNHVNDHPVYDAARRQSRAWNRIIPRRQFVSYSEPGDGTGVFRFRRYAYGLQNTRVDMFDGIAPPWQAVESGSLMRGETYVVRGQADGVVNYGGRLLRNGDTFTAGGSRRFTVNGEAAVYVQDGIRAQAIEGGFSNRWCLFIQPKVYHPSATSIWKPDAYSDYFTFLDRCHFYSGTAGNLRRQVNWYSRVSVDADTGAMSLVPPSLQAEFLAPESMTEYRYFDGANDTRYEADPEAFYSSCRIHEPPIEVRSATIEIDATGREIVVLVLADRLHAHPNAPTTVDANPMAWSSDDLQRLNNTHATLPEDYRTAGNAVREYARQLVDPGYQAVFRTGDSGTQSTVTSLPDAPYGHSYFTTHLVKLVPEPRIDANETIDETDSQLLAETYQQVEWYLRCACEGFLDAATSGARTCEDEDQAGLYNYEWETLNYQASESRDIGTWSLAVRPERAAGFGPLPTVELYAEVHNKLANAWNLLTRVAVYLPWELSIEWAQYDGTRALDPDYPVPPYPCTTGNAQALFQGEAPPTPDTFIGYTPSPISLTASSVAGIEATCTGGQWTLKSRKWVVSWSVQLVDPDSVNAMPETIRDMLSAHGGILLKKVTTETRHRATPTADIGEALTCGGTAFGYGGGGYLKLDSETRLLKTECVIESGGTYNPPTPPVSDFTLMRIGANLCDWGDGVNAQSAHEIEVTEYLTDGFVIDVPLVEVEE